MQSARPWWTRLARFTSTNARACGSSAMSSTTAASRGSAVPACVQPKRAGSPASTPSSWPDIMRRTSPALRVVRSRLESWITKGTPSAESCTSNSTCAMPCRQADSSAGSVFSGKCSASPRCATIVGSMRGIIVVPWILAACIAAACSRQESGWEQARREDSVAGYEAYLARFPTGPEARQARAAIEGLHDAEAWARAGRLATPEAWQRYLGEFPDGRHAVQARQWLIEFIPPGPAPVDGRYVVQLGAYSTEVAARADRTRAAERHAAALAGIGLRIVAPRGPADSIWRLRTDGLAEVQARDLCARLRAGGVDCVPLPDDSAGYAPP